MAAAAQAATIVDFQPAEETNHQERWNRSPRSWIAPKARTGRTRTWPLQQIMSDYAPLASQGAFRNAAQRRTGHLKQLRHSMNGQMGATCS